MSKKLLEAVKSLMGSGDDEGCDGLVCVGLDEFRIVQHLLRKQTGIWHGSVSPDEEEWTSSHHKQCPGRYGGPCVGGCEQEDEEDQE